MKKIYFIIAASLLWVAAFAQSSTPNFLVNSGDIKLHTPFSVSKRISPPSTQSNVSFVINYDTADSYTWGTVNNAFIWDMNIHPASSATIQYCTVAFDSLYNYVNQTGYKSSNVTGIIIDSIFAYVGQQNKSGKDDTLKVNILSVDANGYPTTTVLTSTMTIIPHATPLSSNNNWTYSKLVGWKFNYTLAGATKFAVQLQYYGAKADTLGFLAAFNPFATTCTNPNLSPPLAYQTYFSKIGSGASAFVSNSFCYWKQFSEVLPTTTGGDVYYDCNNNGTDDAGDGKNYIQDIDIFAKVTITTNTAVQEYSSGLSSIGVYPNPAQDITNIRYRLDESTDVSVTLCDLTGRAIAQSSLGKLSAGNHETKISLKDISAGNYLYTIKTEKGQLTGKLIVVK